MNDATTTLLVADDDPSQLMLSEAALAGAGYIVHTAVDGQEAVEKFAAVNPDIVVLDVNMPRMSGIDACRAIRAQAGNRPVPILMLTGRNDLPAITDAYAAGANDFAQKGLNPRLLVERVRFLLRDRLLREELRASQSKLLLAQRIARVGHWELAPDGRTLHVSPMVAELLGVEAAQLARYEDFVQLLDPAEREAVRAAFVTCATGHGGFGFDHRLRATDGQQLAVHQEAEQIEGSADHVIIVTLQDLTRLHRAEESVKLLSFFDTVTGLPNRRHLAEQVGLARKDAGSSIASAVVVFRLHQFDRVAQAQGRDFANRTLLRLGRRIEAELERLGQAGSILWRSDLRLVCRTADDELGVLLRSRVSAEHVATVTHTLLELLAAHGQDSTSEYVPAVSAGVALLAGDAVDAEQWVANARSAAESAKEPRSCAFFSPLPQQQARRRLLMESALRGAVERRELSIVFQPRVAIDTGEIVAVECQPRWDNPQFGATRPEEFLALAEESGIIDEIGRWTIEAACRQMADWSERYKGRFVAATRVSAHQLRDPRLVTAIEAGLAHHKVPAALLQIEVPPAALIDAPQAARQALAALNRGGVRVGIYDFGTGQSALGQVRGVPCQSMTLAKSLLTDLYTDPWAQGVTAAVLAMAKAMHIRSVADGIEDSATADMLRALGCEQVQGQYVSPPMKAKDFEYWLECGGATHLGKAQLLEIDATPLPGEVDTADEDAYWAQVEAGRKPGPPQT